jgi:hypothetical protein
MTEPTVYEIRDASGALVAQHVRYDEDPKRFAWLDETGSTGLKGLPSAALPLYGVHKLNGTAQVVVCEGEKAADALCAAGVHAVGTVTGAAATPGPVALADLTGRDVILWPDADEVGRAHMERIAAGLRALNVAVRTVEWPDAQPHEDAADYVAKGLDPWDLIDALPPFEPPKPEVETWTVRQLADMPSAEEEYIISNGILTKGGKMLIYAGSGAGKTTLLDFIVGPLACGKPFLGKYVVDRPRRTLVIQGELSKAEMSSHAQMLIESGFESDDLIFARMTDLKLPQGQDRLLRLLEQEHAEVLALDPWYRLFAGESSDKAEQVGALFDVCDHILEQGQVEATIVVHHANASGMRTSGSWVFEGWPSTILRLEAVAGVEAQRLLVFEKIRAPSSDLMGKRVQIILDEHGYLPVDKSWEPPQAGPELARIIVTTGGGQMARKELLNRLMAQGDCKLRLANQWLGEAVQGGLLGKMPHGAEMIYQSIPRTEV